MEWDRQTDQGLTGTIKGDNKVTALNPAFHPRDTFRRPPSLEAHTGREKIISQRLLKTWA